MAGLGKKTFQQFDILTAEDTNGYLMDQSVMRFASATARDAAITSPTEGMMCYLDDVNWVMVYTGSAWTITGGDKPFFEGTTSGQGIANNSWTTCTLTTSVNRGSFTNSSGTLTVPQSGFYSVTSTTNISTNATGFRILGLKFNGIQLFQQMVPSATAATNQQLTTAAIINLTAGNTVSTEIYQSSGTTLSSATRFSIIYLGA